jgi:putative ABC transport system permease protein
MIKNFVNIAIRNFLRDKGYSFINVMGLAVGMGCAMLISLYIWDEFRYDNFHDNKNLYRVALHRTFPANEAFWATTPSPIAEVLTREYPEVKKATRLFKIFGDLRVKQNDELYFEPNALAADSNFFDIFSIKLIHGNRAEALRLKNSVVLTESTAKKYFGNEDAIGKQLYLFSDTTSYIVTGITEDVPSNCHFTYDLLLSFVSFPLSESTTWAAYAVYNYIVLDEPASKQKLEEKFPKLVEQYFGPEVENILGKRYEEYAAAGNHHNYHLQKIQDIHLHSDYQQELKPNGDIRNVYLFSVVFFFIIFIAGVNFTNLSTARSFRRAKEIGVRKVHGSLKGQLIVQFLTESVLTTLLSLLIAIIFVISLLSAFNEFTGKSISIGELNPWWVATCLLTLLIFVGTLAGIYPAFVVSSLQPVSILKGQIQLGRSKAIFRNALVILQFGVSIILIISTLVIYRQLGFMKEKKLGFDKDHILVIERANALGSQRHAFTEELKQLPEVHTVGNAFTVPGRQYSGSTFQPIGAEATERINHSITFADFHFPDALGLEFIAGRTFSEDVASDSIAVVVNEALIKRVGWKSAEEALGKKITPVFNRQSQYEIIGVVKDFNFQSLRTPIEPLGIYASNDRGYNPTITAIRFQRNVSADQVVNSVEKIWSKFLPHERFAYTFLDQEFDSLYRQEERFGKIFTLFSTLAIFIAAIGVIGLSTFMASQRTREIGIRKVIGASIPNLLLLLSKDFLKLVVLANVIFWPLAWYGLNEWLSNYPFRTKITPSLFVLTGLITALMVLVSILWQSLKAATANPVKSLRSE